MTGATADAADRRRLRPGPRNLITDVAGLAVGNAEDRAGRSGTTVLLCDRPAVAAVDVRGGAPGTRETDLMHPANLVERVDALVLSGGSAFGLDAASGVMQALLRQGRGYPAGPARVPIVPAAILFDLATEGDRPWLDGSVPPPYRDLGMAACAAAGPDFALGNAGAGLGAKAGRIKGGLGSASALLEGTGITVGALVAVNPAGAVTMPGGGLWAGPLLLPEDGVPPSATPPPVAPPPVVPPDAAGLAADLWPFPGMPASAGANTVIGVVATDAALTRGEALRLAIMAQDGYARAIRPAHTPFDGDTVFALSAGDRPLPEPRAAALYALGALAADTMARAVLRGVWAAEPLAPWPALRGGLSAGSA
ncbi:P1 family peptidase [Rhodospirillum centenum]|uniref:Peptidase family T4, putative n=1 Tax=Rhodospirillum centenum (strain ATCC 51521 / SW) TaxID=414684 RepID=B6IUD1_RHOCS|nr:P1 family peptidase [Rhodospirillum centenum]ACJ00111.1 peptidase family T4, putative [Rhodospirillum centenum SW]